MIDDHILLVMGYSHGVARGRFMELYLSVPEKRIMILLSEVPKVLQNEVPLFLSRYLHKRIFETVGRDTTRVGAARIK